MHIIFSDKYIDVDQFYPFTLTRKVEDIRIGIFTIREKWIKALNAAVVDENTDLKRTNKNGLVISANALPNKEILAKLKMLKPGQRICNANGEVIVKHARESGEIADIMVSDSLLIAYPWHIFQHNAKAIEWDFEMAKKGRRKGTVDATVYISNKKNVFVEKGAVVKHTVINADDGPVFIAKDALVMEGALLRGPLYIGEGAVVKMGAKIYGATTVGPKCTVGGEIKNSVFFAHSNKAHDGYLGDSVVGEWCNLGGGTSNSNLKNTAGDITVHLQGRKIVAGKKCGAFIGDFSRTAINTSINTGTVIGVNANVFGCGLTPAHIPSFSWGYDDSERYRLEAALKDAAEWKKLKGSVLTSAEMQVLTNIYNSKTEIK